MYYELQESCAQGSLTLLSLTCVSALVSKGMQLAIGPKAVLLYSKKSVYLPEADGSAGIVS